MKVPTIPTPPNPVLLDLVLTEINAKLIAGLPWLNNAFGKSQTLTREKEGRNYTFPAVYAGKKDYFPVLPDDRIPNISWFDVADPVSVVWVPRQSNRLTCEFGLVFWFDVRTIYPGNFRATENVKADILGVLREMNLVASRFEISGIYEKPGNIYKGFDLSRIKSKYLEHPFAGFRFNGELTFDEILPNC